MDTISIIREAFNYPINNIKGWLMIAILFLINGILKQVTFTSHNEIVTAVLTVISVIIYVIILGVSISIIRSTIQGSDEIPMISPETNIIDGIKSFVISIIYLLIPTLISILLTIPFGLYDKILKIVETSINLSVNSTLNSTGVVASIPSNLLAELFLSISILTVIGFLLYVFFGFLGEIASARFAETGSLAQALNIPAIVSKISSIGWGTYIFYTVLVLIILIVLSMLAGLVVLIPYVGAILETFIVESFMFIFAARALGSIYLEG